MIRTALERTQCVGLVPEGQSDKREKVIDVLRSAVSHFYPERGSMEYGVAGIDVHKKLLAVVVADVSHREYRFERRKFETGDQQLHELSDWLSTKGVKEVVMESTAQYWRPVWHMLEGKFQLHLAQAQSNRAPRGRKRDFGDAERLVRRLMDDELDLSFVPDAEQRFWRTMTRTRLQLMRDRVGTVAEPDGGISGGVADQAVEPPKRLIWSEWKAHFVGVG